ncbi:MAG TPA: glycerophosphodiester phosphodiesterase [Candidatus Binataceae bacterium]|jgi:glycerophosphoryl diester phosphodiesterase|nr:glycerophosphodiester phosphodiesterase [Candidatus Binataceae bacterium]
MRTGLKSDFFAPPGPRLIAHRGGGGVMPENTLEAFSAAYRDGIRYFELDIHTSRDGVLMVCHDDDLQRTTDLAGTINQLTYDEIARADAGFRFETGGRFPLRGRGVRVPRLTDVLSLFNDAFFVIEIKQVEPSLTAALNQVLTATATRRRVLIASEHQRPLDEIRVLAPELPTSFSTPEVLGFFAALMGNTGNYRIPADALQIPPSHGSMMLATPTSIAAAHQHGVEMHNWTVNDEAEMRNLLAMGADGIITDYPARLLAVTARR